jgi:predicted DsbA family dithiol-disulfide isomerase
MPYPSTITFTLDTICLWTYLAFLRLQKALTTYHSLHPDSPASFTLKLTPYQLYPDMSPEGVDKYQWYKNEKYNSSEERMGMYMNTMRGLGEKEGVGFNFEGGMAGNTLESRRVLWSLQHEEEGRGGDEEGRAIK